MKVVIATTIMENESVEFFLKNIKTLTSFGWEVTSIANTNKTVNANFIIHEIGDIKDSRESLLRESYQHYADMYFILDSDICLPANNIMKEVYNYSDNYDFISMYYKQDPPIPAFYTLASSLTDFYHAKQDIFSSHQKPFFDDSDFNSSTYSSINSNQTNKKLVDILHGKSFARDIDEFTNIIDEEDTTTGGASIYFNKAALLPTYTWENYRGKSLTWYDSYRTFKLKDNFKFAKIPIFVNHLRTSNNIGLSWDSVISYINGLNLYKYKTDSNWNQESIISHTKELWFFIRGIIKKINIINITKEERKIIDKIIDFMNIDIFKFLKDNIIIWKSE